MKKIITFHSNGELIAQCKFHFRSETHEKQLEKSRKKLVSEYHKIPQKNILVFIDEVVPPKRVPLKHAA